MTRRTAGVLAAVAVLVATGTSAASAGTTGPYWRNLPTAAPVRAGALDSVAVGDAHTAWAAGIEDPAKPNCFGHYCPVTALLRWDGKKWSRQQPPVQFAPVSLAAADAKHAWAVGIGVWGSVSLYWNGSTWKQTRYASGAPIGVSAGRDGSAWSIAGAVKDGAPTVLRWTRGGWSPVAVPLPPNAGLSSVGVRTSSDAWLTGQYGQDKDHMHPLVMHWNGRSWSRTPVPDGVPNGEWMRIAPVSATSVWAIRSPGASALMHWNGRVWSQTAPIPGGRGALSVVGDGAWGAWVIPFTTGSATHSYYLHWTGRSWQAYYGPRRNGNAQLGELALIPGGRSLLSAGAIQEVTPVRRKMPMVEIFR